MIQLINKYNIKITKNTKIFDPCVGKGGFVIDLIDFLMNNKNLIK